MTPEEFESIGNQACVSVAAGHDCMWQGDLLEPHLWEALRVELQRRYRRSTGETMAVLSIDNAPSPQTHVQGWRTMDSAPLDKTAVIIAVPTERRDDWIIGEAYFDPEHYGDGDWWWAGNSHGDYHGGPIREINHHGPAFWQPMPAPPIALATAPEASSDPQKSQFVEKYDGID